MRLKAKAFAKLNLFLDVLGKREDGYHDIDSVMQSVSLYDEVELSPRDDGKVVITYNDPSFSREDDIVSKAYGIFSEYSGFKNGVDIHIVKNIPTFAGLGGFSAVLAVVLKMLNIASRKNYSDDIMLTLCKELGADVPFCYNGGTARTKCIGDKIQKLNTPDISLVLLKEGDKQSTGHMYAELDSLGLAPSSKISDMLTGISSGNNSLVLGSVYNVFENCWDFEKMKAVFDGCPVDAVFLSGSGPTTVAAFCDNAAAKRCYNKLLSMGRSVYFARTVDRGNIIE